jgi:acetyl esterase/lipase
MSAVRTAGPIAVTRDVIYKEDSGDRLGIDVYEPSDSRGAIFDLHGGGWFHGDKQKDEDLATRLAGEGYVVFVPNYRLTPKHIFPTARTDVIDAMEWALASSFQFDRDRLAFLGTSAGGNLAVEAALLTGRPGVGWSGPLDLQGFIEETDGTAAATAAPTEDFSNISSAAINQKGRDDPFLRWCILGNVGGDRSLLPEATPVNRASSASGPVYMVNSIGEFVPPDGAMAMQRQLSKVGVESTVQLLPGTIHAKGYLDLAIGGSLEFLARSLKER